MKKVSMLLIGTVLLNDCCGAPEFSIDDLKRKPAETRLKEIAELPWEAVRFYVYSWGCFNGGSPDPYAMCKSYPRTHSPAYTEGVYGLLFDTNVSVNDLEKVLQLSSFTKATSRSRGLARGGTLTFPQSYVDNVAKALDQLVEQAFVKAFTDSIQNKLYLHAFNLATAYRLKDEDSSKTWIAKTMEVVKAEVSKLATEAKQLSNNEKRAEAYAIADQFSEPHKTSLRQAIDTAYAVAIPHVPQAVPQAERDQLSILRNLASLAIRGQEAPNAEPSRTVVPEPRREEQKD